MTRSRVDEIQGSFDRVDESAMVGTSQTALPQRRMRDLVEFLASDQCEGRAPGTPGGLLARSRLIEELATIGVDPVLDEGYEQPIPPIGGSNLIGVIRGSGGTDRHVAIGAHYDHLGIHFDTIHPGADDNASGVAVLLEVARMLVARRGQLGSDVLIILFDAEEPPYFHTENMGSMYLTAHPPLPLHTIDLFINLDLVGHDLGPGSLPRDAANVLFVSGAERVGLAGLIDGHEDRGLVLRRLGANVVPPSSDHHAFQEAGVASTFFHAGRDRHYHTPNDTPEKLDYERMKALSEMLEHLLIEVSNFPERIVYRPEASDDAATLETLRFMLDHASVSDLDARRISAILDRMSDRSGPLTASDNALLTSVLERLTIGLA